MKSKIILAKFNNNIIIVIFTVSKYRHRIILVVGGVANDSSASRPRFAGTGLGCPVAADLGGQEEQVVEADGRQMSVTSGIAIWSRGDRATIE